MDIYFFRHGIAAPRSPDLLDAERALTDKGIQRTQAVAAKLKTLDLSFDKILTSPYRRAHQTADILFTLGLGDRPVILPALSPAGTFQAGWDYIQTEQRRSAQKLILIGHQPNLGHWAETLLQGQQTDQIILKKAGIIGIRLAPEHQPSSHHRLFLLTSPKWIL